MAGSNSADRVKDVRGRIEEWRGTRRKRSPMPEALWGEAASLAGDLGTYAVARALGINYGSLKRRVDQRPPDDRPETEKTVGFIELSRAPFVAAISATSESVIEVVANGARLTIRLAGGAPVDVAAVVNAFQERRS